MGMRLAWVMALSSVVCIDAALALDGERKRSSLIEEVVVTAQKREQSAEDVGIAISAFSDDTLKALGITDTADLTNLVAGFSYTDSGFSIPVYTLRGVGFNEISQTATSAVGVYIDEVNIPCLLYTSDAADE